MEGPRILLGQLVGCANVGRSLPGGYFAFPPHRHLEPEAKDLGPGKGLIL